MDKISILLLFLDVTFIITFGIFVFWKPISLPKCEHKNTFTYVDNVTKPLKTVTTITCLDCKESLGKITDLAKSDYPKCTCKDVNQCDTWCSAKDLFSKYPPHEAM